jgi:hypothetical protein
MDRQGVPFGAGTAVSGQPGQVKAGLPDERSGNEKDESTGFDAPAREDFIPSRLCQLFSSLKSLVFCH